MYKPYKTTGINKNLHNWYVDRRFNERVHVNLFDRSLETYIGNVILFSLFNRLLKSHTLACHYWLFISMDKQSFENSLMKYQQLDQRNIPKIF